MIGHPVVHEWWGSLLGPGKPFDTDKYWIFCGNMLGSCYGSAGPTSIDPHTNEPYGNNFPYVTIRDTVTIHAQLLSTLGITRIRSVIGGSIGGMQALEWAFVDKQTYGYDIDCIVSLACGSRQSAWAIGLNHIQRSMIYNDPKWLQGDYKQDEQPINGLGSARQLAMCSYRTHHMYNQKFDRNIVQQNKTDKELFEQCYFCAGQPNYQIESYLQYQGKKFHSRFDAVSYIRMSQQTDSHDVGRNRGGHVKALNSIKQPVCIVGIRSDVLYPIDDQIELHTHINNNIIHIIDSLEGHDGFLLEQKHVGKAITDFLHKVQNNQFKGKHSVNLTKSKL